MEVSCVTWQGFGIAAFGRKSPNIMDDIFLVDFIYLPRIEIDEIVSIVVILTMMVLP